MPNYIMAIYDKDSKNIIRVRFVDLHKKHSAGIFNSCKQFFCLNFVLFFFHIDM